MCLALFLSTGGFSIKFQNSSTTPTFTSVLLRSLEKISYLLHCFWSLPLLKIRHVVVLVKVDGAPVTTSTFLFLLLLLLSGLVSISLLIAADSSFSLMCLNRFP
ncbi:unnamed protein product [Microthlaspi erraticum]|uniref:Uncharacterized protein n=1 Tax=Microthlaspi erraticum TaxID=1685480 RepID=A0A6D2HKD4_9BRAS|nr:unnamed protein product [Microthlaspi erraticum]